jgi:hypothetical protein
MAQMKPQMTSEEAQLLIQGANFGLCGSCNYYHGAVTNIIIRTIEEYRKNFDLAVVGERGDGKSFTALTMGYSVAKHFRTPFSVDDCVHFRGSDFLQRVDILTRGKEPEDVQIGNVLLIDEAGRGMDAQKWFDENIQKVAQELETYRLYRMFSVFTTPSLSNITKRVRMMASGIMKPHKVKVNRMMHMIRQDGNIDYSNGISKWRFYIPWSDPAPTKQTSTGVGSPMMRPRDHNGVLDMVCIACPPKRIIDDYERKKRRFLEDERAKALATPEMQTNQGTTAKPNIVTIKRQEEAAIAEKVLTLRDIYIRKWDKKWVVNAALVSRDFGCSNIAGERIKKDIQQRLNQKISAKPVHTAETGAPFKIDTTHGGKE